MANSFLNINGSGNGWNYSRPNEDGYSTCLSGQLVKIDTPIAHEFSQNGQGAPRFWDTARTQPVRNVKFFIADANNNVFEWVFAKIAKRPNSAWNKVIEAMAAVAPNCTNIGEMLGRQITVTTQEPPQGYGYSAQNPRPWAVQFGPEMPRQDCFEYAVTDTAADYVQQAQAPAPAPTAAPAPQVQAPSMTPQAAAVYNAMNKAQQASLQQQTMHASVNPMAAQQGYVPEVADQDIPF